MTVPAAATASDSGARAVTSATAVGAPGAPREDISSGRCPRPPRGDSLDGRRRLGCPRGVGCAEHWPRRQRGVGRAGRQPGRPRRDYGRDGKRRRRCPGIALVRHARSRCVLVAKGIEEKLLLTMTDPR